MSSTSYTVEAILKATTSQFTAGMQEAIQSVEALKKSTTSISDGMMSIGKGLTAAITAPAVAGVTAVVKSYADLEQAIGGVETLFIDSAKTVIANSETAYKRAGVSATSYMEQLTSFSATLLQGLGGDTAQAAAYGDKAILQMSDNANKFGTSINEIQNAYQGFAKGNFTMLDNLKLGYGGTQAEMARLVNESGVLNGEFEATAENIKDIPFHKLIEALQVTQDNLGITGTTAEEARKTVAGSFAQMVAAGQNLLAGFGQADADIGKLMKNLWESVKIFANNIKRVLGNIWDNLPMAEWQKWVLAIAVSAGPILMAIAGIIKAVTGIGRVFSTLGTVLSNPFGLALVAIAALVAGFVWAYKNSETFRNIVNSAVESVIKTFNKLKEFVGPVFDKMVAAFKKSGVGAFLPLIGGVGLAIAAIKKLVSTDWGKMFKFKPEPPKNPFKPLTGFAKGVANSIKGIFTGLGKMISSIFKGVGQGIGAAFRGLATVNPATIAALAVPILALGAAFAIMGMQGQGIATILEGIGSVVLSVGEAIGTILTMAFKGFAEAVVILAPALPIIASALASLSPLVVAVGEAFAAAAPFITALGDAFATVLGALPPVITALGSAISEIVTAVTPIVEILSSTFTTVVQIVADAIVQVVQALAPFIPALTEMVVAVAPVLSQLVEAFNNLISQISPILDSLTQLFETLGEQISDILDGAKGVIESFGDSVRNVLDGIAGIFDSMGKAALNAGKGVKEMAQGIKILVDLKLGDLVATLGAVGSGLGDMAKHSGAMTELGSAMTKVGTGMTLFSTGATPAAAAMASFSTAIGPLKETMAQLPEVMTTAATAFATFSSQAVAGMAGLSAINAPITLFKTQITSIGPALLLAGAGITLFATQLTLVGTSVGTVTAGFTALSMALTMITASMLQIGSSATQVVGQLNGIPGATQAVASAFNSMSSQVQSAMNRALQAVISVGNRMKTQGRQIGQQTAQNLAQGIRSGSGQVSSAMSSLVQAAVSRAQAGVGAMRNAGAMIGQGLAQGMLSALGAVTAAADALVAQAERAAQAKAKIHSPSRLFRDEVGIFIGQGMAVGIEKSTKYVTGAIDDLVDEASQIDLRLDDLFDNRLNYRANLGEIKGDITHQLVNRREERKFDALSEALEVIQASLERDTVLNINGQEFARATGRDMTLYQANESRINKLLREGRR